MTEQEATEQMRRACRISPATRFEIYGAIKPKVGPIIKSPELKANYMQRLESEIVTYCLLNDIPIRIIRLKPRRKGSSTWSVWKLYALCSDMLSNACIIGGAHYQGDKLFQILKTYASNDGFNPKMRCQVLDREARWSNGSTCDKITAANQAAGRSATYQIIVATELAYWHEEGVADAASVLAGLLKTVENAPRTMIDLESTANGAAGVFYERWQDAITFEELKSGRRGFVRVFAPWFEFEDSRRDPALERFEEQVVPPDKVEEVRRKFNLDDWQIAWMQWAVREECKKDFAVFCEEYPFDDVGAFRTSGRRRFNVQKIETMIERARQFPPTFGVLDATRDGQCESITWRPTSSEEARLLRWEHPKVGAKYLISVDSMTGETQVSGKDPDNHAVGVLRAGFFESGRGWVPPKLVARLIHDWGEWERSRKYVLRYDIDILEEEIWRLAQYYGNAMIVPEMNMDRGLVELLKLRNGANIYERGTLNRRDNTRSKALGWVTNVRTREAIIDNLARAIREQGNDGEGIDIFCPITLAELQTFIVRPDGRSEAMAGSKDDTVLQIAIGLACITSATTYAEPWVEVKLPWDLRLLEETEAQRSSGAAQRW